MKKKFVIIVLLLVFIVSFGVNKLFFDNSSSVEENIQDVEDVPKNLLSMMLETDTASGEYEMTTRFSWPTIEDGYVFNTSLSKCENGSKLRWDDENNAVVMQASVSDKCYVYFDKLVPPVVVDVVIDTSFYLLSPLIKAYVESQYDIDTYYFNFKGNELGTFDNLDIVSKLPYIWINYNDRYDISKFNTNEVSLINFNAYSSATGDGDYEISVYAEDIYGQISNTYVFNSYVGFCFIAGTKVQALDGLVNIENINVGDYIYTINENTNQIELKQVINTAVSSSKIIYKITAGDTIVEPSPRHPFYVVDKGWTRAYNLEVGDLILTTNGALKIDNIEVDYYAKDIVTYNLTVEDNHNFLVTEKGFLVHNAPSAS